MWDSQEYGSQTSRTTTKSKRWRNRSFHLGYLELCRAKNYTPIADIRRNNKDQTTLDFFGDKLSVTDWQLINAALYNDQALRNVAVRLRKCVSPVLSHIDSERKAKLFKHKPVVYTKFIFADLIKSLSNCIQMNAHLVTLHIEGLPLSESYIEIIAKSLSTNTHIKEISFARSNLYDSGCEIICNTLKYLDNVEKLNLCDTGLTTKGAEHVAHMIKIQKISRFTAGWQQSLRYRHCDTSNIPGLREISLAHNPQIGDYGLHAIADVLQDDIWVRGIDMENCGLTDRAANLLLECLKSNKFVSEFNIRGNPGISKFLLRHIREQLRKDNECYRTGEDLLREFTEGLLDGDELAKDPHITIQQIITQLKASNAQLELERRVRKKAEQQNEKLTAQIIAYEKKLESLTSNVPDGYVVVKNESLQSIIDERNSLQKLIGKEHSELASPHYLQTSPRYNNMNNFPETIAEEIKFKTPLPEPSVSPSESPRSQLKSARPPNRIRKVKSEMKYIEKKNKTHRSIMKGTKSDYDYGTDTDVPQFERNIGDTVANIDARQSHHIHHHQQKLTRRTVHYATNIQYVKKRDMDEISLSTPRSRASDANSAESDTLRRNDNATTTFQQRKAYENSKLLTPPSPPRPPNKEYGQGEGSAGRKNKRRSPRSLFLGLCED